MKLKQLLSDFFNFFIRKEEGYTWKKIKIGLLIMAFLGLIGWVYTMAV